jgi:hypothetical protein
VSQTFELSLKIKIVIKELNFNLMFLTICHNFHNLICKKPNLHNVYFSILTLYKFDACPSFLCPPIVHQNDVNKELNWVQNNSIFFGFNR